jgi:hypothetical protein
MKTLPFTVALLVCLLTSGCQIVDEADYETIQKVKSGQYALIKDTDLSLLKSQAELGKGVGRYQIHKEGLRTWRIDTSTGKVCLLLTSEADWKKPDTVLQGCS